MTFKTGTKFGTYEIVEPLGAGGMGEVSRATDSRLKRDIAIKVLPDEFSLDAEELFYIALDGRLMAVPIRFKRSRCRTWPPRAAIRFPLERITPLSRKRLCGRSGWAALPDKRARNQHGTSYGHPEPEGERL